MKKSERKLITICLTFMLLLMSFIGNRAQVYANNNVHVINPNPENIILVPGETVTLKIPIRAVGADITSPIISADASGTPYTVSTPILRTEGLNVPLNNIFMHLNQYIEIDVTVAETAKIGIYPIDLVIYGNAFIPSIGDDNVSTKLVVNTQILEEKEPAQLTINNIKMNNTAIGQDMTLSFKIKNDGEIAARNVYVSIDYADTGMIAGYAAKRIKTDDIASNKEVEVSLPIKVLPTAKPGIEMLRVNLTHKKENGEEVGESHDIYVTLIENINTPNLNLSDFTYNEAVMPGENLGMILNIKNNGISTAINPRIYIDESSIGTATFIKGYYSDYIELRNIKSGDYVKAEVPLLVSKGNKGGEHEVIVNLVYFDDKGVEYRSKVTLYPDIQAEGIAEDGTPIVLISNVLQSPKQPVAGGRLEVSFDMENKSAVDLNELKISLKDLIGNTFIPVKSDPYQYIGTLKAGTTKRITIPLTVSEEIREGLNNLLISYSYTGGGDSVNIPIIDVQNDLGSASKPKLIISKYEADVDEIRAGGVFNFNFEIRNTHSSVAANNIIVTVSGKSPGGEVFTVTQGSNSFFINKIGPGETFSESLEMKVKSDTATNAYPIFVTIDYEYDGIEPNPTTGKIGETEEHELNLQVTENARPVVDYVNVYSWDMGVTVGNPATLAFEFYNMGKSTLNNVVATVEGDFTNSSGSMYFMGNVMAGSNAYAEFEVIPNVEGIAYGVVNITYEDSNGDEQIYTKEFEASVMGAQPWDPDMNGDGGVDVFNPTVPEPKKEILPLWLFITIEIAILIIFVLVTRKVIISIYKSRLRKKEDEMY